MRRMKRIWAFLLFFQLALVSGCAAAGNNPKNSATCGTLLENKDYLWIYGKFAEYREGGETIYGRITGEGFVEVPEQSLELELTFRGVTGKLQMQYCVYEGEGQIISWENNPVTVGEDEYDFYPERLEGDYLYLSLFKNAQRDEWSYPLLYDLKTGELVDYLAGIQINKTALADLPQLSSCNAASPNEERYMSSNGEIFVIDPEAKSAKSLNEMVGEEDIVLFQILENGYFLLVPETGDEEKEEYRETSCRGIYYDVATGEKETVLEGVLLGKLEAETDGIRIRTIGNQGLLMKKNGRLYVRNHETGKEWEIGGKSWGSGINGIEDVGGAGKAIISSNDSCGIIDFKTDTFEEISMGETGKIVSAANYDADSFLIVTESADGTYALHYLKE